LQISRLPLRIVRHMQQPSAEISRLKACLGTMPEAVLNPPLIVLSGLPGSGKSYFSHQLSQRLPAAIVESDALRKCLYASPTYSAEESARLFDLIHSLIDHLLALGVPVILDATNLAERKREHLYHIAQRRGAKLVLVRVEAPPAAVKARLEGRERGVNPEDQSEADWQVYQRMRDSAEQIRHPHFAVDTSRDITPVIEKVLRAVRR